jgi:hypothetical protein
MYTCIYIYIYMYKIFVRFHALASFLWTCFKIGLRNIKYLLFAQKNYYFFHNKRKTLHNNPMYVTRIERRAVSYYKFTNALFRIFMSILCQFIVHKISIFVSSCPSCSESLGRKLRTELCNTTYKWKGKKWEGPKYHLECDARETWRRRGYCTFTEGIP